MSFLQNLNWRYATKKFDGRIFGESDLNTIVEAIRLAPSSIGTQPYHIIVARGDMKDKLINSSGQVSKLGASHLFIFCSRTDYPVRAEAQIENTAKVQNVTVESLAGLAATVSRGTSKPIEQLRPWAERQVYIALGFGLAACAELKIDACPMEGFKPEEFSKILDLPEYIQPVAIMAVGYRDPDDSAQPPKRAKVRFPKEDLFTFK